MSYLSTKEFLEISRNAYVFSWKNIRALIKAGALPWALGMGLDIFLPHAADKPILWFLVVMVKTAAIGYFITFIARLIALNEHEDPNDPAAADMRTQAMKKSILALLLLVIGLFFVCFVFFQLISSQMVTNLIASPSNRYEMYAFCFIFFGFFYCLYTWGLRLVAVPLLIAAGEPPFGPTWLKMDDSNFQLSLFILLIFASFPVLLSVEVIYVITGILFVWSPLPANHWLPMLMLGGIAHAAVLAFLAIDAALFVFSLKNIGSFGTGIILSDKK